MLRYQRALDTWMSEDLVGEAVQCLLDMASEIGKPDVIVTDPFLTAAALAAEALSVPVAVCGWPAQRELNDDYLFPVQKTLGNASRERITRLSERFGLRGTNFSAGRRHRSSARICISVISAIIGIRQTAAISCHKPYSSADCRPCQRTRHPHG